MKNLKLLYLALPLVMATISCGTQTTSSNADVKSEATTSQTESSSVAKTSLEDKTSSEAETSGLSSITNEETSTEPEENKLEKLYGDYDKFYANYKDLMDRNANSLTYFNRSKTTSGKDQPAKITVTIDDDEYLRKTVYQDSDGNDLEPQYKYYHLADDEYCEVSYDGSIYSKSARYKIGTPDSLHEDVITYSDAQEKFNSSKDDGNAISDISSVKYDVNLNQLRSDLIVENYEFFEEDGVAYIDFSGIQADSYFGNYFTVELDMNSDGDIISGFFRRDMYMNSGWDSTNKTKVDGADPLAWFSCSVSNVIYSELDNSDLFDPSAYFANSVEGIAYHYYQQTSTGESVEISQAEVGDYITMNSLDTENIVVSPSTACDISSLYITSSSDPNVISFVDAGTWGYWQATGVGSTTITIGNSFKKNIASVTIEVVEKTEEDTEEPTEEESSEVIPMI